MEQTILSRTEVFIFIGLLKFLIIVVFYFVRNFHKEGISELKSIKHDISDMKDDIHELRRHNALSEYKFETGHKEFEKIESHQRDQDLKIDRNNELVNNLEIRVTKLEVVEKERRKE